MTIQEFIEKAIEGGYKRNTTNVCALWQMMLDPLAWQAVGKVDGWGKRVTYYNSFTDGKENNDTWRLEMHRLIDALADGKTIEDYLSTLG